MDKKEALEIISMIADGLDPYCEINSSDNLPENNPVTIMAICTAIASLITQKDRDELASIYKTKKIRRIHPILCRRNKAK